MAVFATGQRFFPARRLRHETRNPTQNCYWVFPAKFLASEYPGSHDPAIAKTKLIDPIDAGVTSFIDLTKPYEGLEPCHHLIEDLSEKPISVKSFPIMDFSVPDSKDFTVEILDHIDRSMSQGGVVYFHFRGGVGRSCTIVGCWLSWRPNNDKAVVKRLKELRSQCRNHRRSNSLKMKHKSGKSNI